MLEKHSILVTKVSAVSWVTVRFLIDSDYLKVSRTYGKFYLNQLRITTMLFKSYGNVMEMFSDAKTDIMGTNNN